MTTAAKNTEKGHLRLTIVLSAGGNWRSKHGKSDMDCSMDYFCLNPFDIMVPVRT